MAATIVQSKSAAQNTAAGTVTGTFDTPATAGNLLVFVVGSDDYATANAPTGWTQSTGCRQETFLGHYLWWKVAAGGETSVAKALNASATFCWATAEISGLEASPLDVSNGNSVTSASNTYTTPSVTPTTGSRFAVVSMAGSRGASGLTDLNTYINNFIELLDVATVLASGTRDIIGLATKSLTGDGSTTQQGGCTYNATPDARSGIIIVFKESAGASTQTIVVPLVTVASTLFSPKIVQEAEISVINSPSTIFSPSVQQNIAIPLVSSPSTILTPVVDTGASGVTTPLVSVPSNIFNPLIIRLLDIISAPVLQVPSAILNPTVVGGEVPLVANLSLADEARVNMLADRVLTDPQLLTNTDLMRLVLADGAQVLVTKTDASAAVHLWRYYKTLRDT